jgi:hypothetical protein
MQLISVYLYQNKIDVFTNASAGWLTKRYRRVYNRNVKIYRGVDNRIDIQVRNSDEKAADVTGSTLVFNLVERETQALVAQRDCVTVSASTGKYYVILTERELLDIETGFYQYSVYNELRTNNSDGTYLVTSRTPLYIDSQYDTLANVEVLDSGTGEIIPSTEIKAFSLHKSFGEAFSDYYISGIINARPQTTTPQSLHTFQLYCTNYSGEVVIQGSLDDDNDPKNWVNIGSPLTLTAQAQAYRNVTGKYNWFRIKHTPSGGANTAQFTIAQTVLLNYQVSIYSAGAGYSVGNVITILGNRLGGEEPTNNLTITVTSVNQSGGITGISWTGTSYNGVRTFVLSGTTGALGTVDKVLYR